MKNTLIALLGACILLAGSANRANAQGFKQVIGFTDENNFKQAVAALLAMIDASEVNMASPSDENPVHEKALKDFKNRFSQAMDVKWFTLASGFFSYFKTDGFDERAFYTKKGRWKYTLKFYNELKLPKDIRNIVRSTYFDYKIRIVEEVDRQDKLIYIIQLEDEKTIKNLRVTEDGRMDILSDMDKA
jgi:hypothetical protein